MKKMPWIALVCLLAIGLSALCACQAQEPAAEAPSAAPSVEAPAANTAQPAGTQQSGHAEMGGPADTVSTGSGAQEIFGKVLDAEILSITYSVYGESLERFVISNSADIAAICAALPSVSVGEKTDIFVADGDALLMFAYDRGDQYIVEFNGDHLVVASGTYLLNGADALFSAVSQACKRAEKF